MKKLNFMPGARTIRLSLLVLLELFCWMDTAVASACQSDETIVLGTDGAGIRSVRFDACTGSFTGPAQLVAEASKVRWLARHPKLPVIYAGVENQPGQGLVQAYTLNERSGNLQLLGQASSGGSGPTYLWVDEPSNTVFAANFGSGSVSSLPVQADGNLGSLTGTLSFTGSGPHKRQTSAHAHGIAVDPSGRHVLVADMGSDRVWINSFDRSSQSLKERLPSSWQAPSGSGPRRAIFARNDRRVYVLSELDAHIFVLSWDPQSLQLSQTQRVSLSSAATQDATKSASEMVLGQDGRFLYVANRGDSSLQVYQVEQSNGNLTLLQTLPSGGDAPWAFDIHASGRWLLVANYRSNQLRLLGIDSASGLLKDMGQSVDAPAPLSVLFAN